jgi:hypothetical protein
MILDRVKASELMKGTIMTVDVSIDLVIDWRFRLGFWVMKLGARLMGSSLKAGDRIRDRAS